MAISGIHDVFHSAFTACSQKGSPQSLKNTRVQFQDKMLRNSTSNLLSFKHLLF